MKMLEMELGDLMTETQPRLKDLCRLCCCIAEETFNLITPDHYHLTQILWVHWNISLQIKDDLPKSVCKSCFDSLLNWVQFVEKCKRAQLFLNDYREKKVPYPCSHISLTSEKKKGSNIQSRISTNLSIDKTQEDIENVDEFAIKLNPAEEVQCQDSLQDQLELNQVEVPIKIEPEEIVFPDFLPFQSDANQVESPQEELHLFPCERNQQLSISLEPCTENNISETFSTKELSSTSKNDSKELVIKRRRGRPRKYSLPVLPVEISVESVRTGSRLRTKRRSVSYTYSSDSLDVSDSEKSGNQIIPAQFKCNQSNNTYKYNKQLKRHFIYHTIENSKQYPFSCKICLSSFSRKDLYQTHLQHMHSNKKN